MNDLSSIEAPLPKGVNDFLPETADQITYIASRIHRVFQLWGFRRIITPLLEYEDVLALAMGEELRSKTFRFEDRQSGRLLAIPPDITPQVARIVATRMKGLPLPHRIYYNGKVLRQTESASGKSREIFQSGVELFGLDSPEADAEMVAMAVEVLQELGFEGFKIDLGQVDFYRGILEEADLSANGARRLREAIAKKEVSALSAILEGERIPDRVKEEIALLPRLFGGPEVLTAAAKVQSSDRAKRALDNLRQVISILEIHGLSQHLTIDLGEIRGLDYHSGITFEGFVPGVGEAVCSGGRYDELTANYGFPCPATGFAFNIMTLLGALSQRPEVQASRSRDFLIFNQKEDRREALEVAAQLRKLGYTCARDIIKRDLDSSLAYARTMNIRTILVIGAAECAEDEAYLVRVSDRAGRAIKKELLLEKGLPNLEPEGENHG
ncbi:ATP phosphoribosyltransferase regulatory subunit [Geomesophilobacter sediminis]|uniref:ATP phosphoribosyltransferase regulatory subunit n=1 Tax=Geomesophilobacter sediminis TaxID=2798584 RepID=A0A8J7M164_9BACT|nr:ATP phosphoribosyltransferase regulatory subunit [Geomesophilobacter sediminis]MBJ6726721.1 ATP phosphoribosyltransferase regulatory subunit [Geomesophilobacter sediminis]